MRFHYIAMPHLPVTREYQSCAFTQKVHKLTRMLLDKGHTVFLYGVDNTDIKHKNLEFISAVTLDDVRKEWGDGDNRFELGYDWKKTDFRHDLNKERTKCHFKFRSRAVKEIKKRKKDDDFLLLSQGMYHKNIADDIGLYLTCEPGIGYRGSYAQFRAFESAYIQNFTYGSENPRKSINGKYYDRVIPNYFDLDDFEFGEKPDNYLFYMGRMIKRKGLSTALLTAQHLNKRIILAGQSSEKIEINYKKAEFIGTVGVEDRKKLLSKALVTFLPTLYLEPFGGTSVESMLSGTPAITTNFGVFPETIRNGVGGYRCDTLNDFVVNTKKAFKLDRKKVRDYAISRYSTKAVNELYEKWWTDLYQVYLSTKGDVKGWHLIK